MKSRLLFVMFSLAVLFMAFSSAQPEFEITNDSGDGIFVEQDSVDTELVEEEVSEESEGEHKEIPLPYYITFIVFMLLMLTWYAVRIMLKSY